MVGCLDLQRSDSDRGCVLHVLLLQYCLILSIYE